MIEEIKKEYEDKFTGGKQGYMHQIKASDMWNWFEQKLKAIQMQAVVKPVACGIKMYGWYDSNKNEVSMIYRSKKLVQMCSPDGFKRNTEDGEGFIADLEITVSKPSV